MATIVTLVITNAAGLFGEHARQERIRVAELLNLAGQQIGSGAPIAAITNGAETVAATFSGTSNTFNNTP